jgi:hypothetical protein
LSGPRPWDSLGSAYYQLGEIQRLRGEFVDAEGSYRKASLAGRSRPCFLVDGQRVILPAYGCYTGGLRATDPTLAALMAPGALAILTGRQALAVPMPR